VTSLRSRAADGIVVQAVDAAISRYNDDPKDRPREADRAVG